MLISEMIKALQDVHDKHGDLPVVKYDDIDFRDVNYFDPQPVRLSESKKLTGHTVYGFIAYTSDEPTHVEL